MFLLLAALARAEDPPAENPSGGTPTKDPATPEEGTGPTNSMLHRDPVGFGAGFVVGLPTGLSFAFKKSDTPIWFDASVAWRFDNGGGLLLQGGVEWTITTLNTPEWEDIHFPVYIGVGPRFLVNQGGSVVNNGTENYLGVRIPVGMSVYHQDVPLEGLLELSPVIKLFPNTGVAFDIVVGARFYFGP